MIPTAGIAITAYDNASKVFGRIESSFNRFGNTIRRVAMAAGLYFGTREIIGFVKSSIAAYQEHEIAIQHLMDALVNYEVTDKAAIAGLREFAAEIQRTSTVSDEAAIEVMSMGVSIGRFTGDTLKAATIAAIGFSKAFKLDFEGAMRLVSKAAEGVTYGLQRQGIVLDLTKSKAEIFHDVLERGAMLYNVATGEINTQRGSMEQSKNEWHDFKEELGGAVGGYFNNFIDGVRIVIIAIKKWKLTLDWLWIAFKLGLVVTGSEIKWLFVTAIPAWLEWFRSNWRLVFTDIWNATKAIFTNMWTNIKEFFIDVVAWFRGEEFNFEWTGLLEGFESTLKELPIIGQRELSKTELALRSQLAGLTLEISKKIVETFYPAAIDINKILKNAKLPEGVIEEEKKEEKAKRQRGLPAEESRFLTFAPGTRFNSTERNTENTAKNTGRIAKLIEGTNKQLMSVAEAMKALGGKTLAVSDFK
jgi:hypothetical protein